MNQEQRTITLTRREALKRGLLGVAGLALIDRCGRSSLPAAEPPRPAIKPARAKAVIQIWMWGGPSHLDTFDPKPQAGYDYCGPLNKPIPTKVAGIQICQLLPLLAQQADKYSIIRGMTHGVNGHETAAYIVQTGRDPADRLVYPGLGAIVSLFKGYDHGYKGLLPPYIVLTKLQGRFSEQGFLGSRYRPFATGGDPNLKRFAVEGIAVEAISEQRQLGRRQLFHELDSLGKAMPPNPQFEQFDRCEIQADRIAAETGKIFDLSQEKDELRERYGRSTFGQSCLMARRLVENGAPFVTINYGGWDTHKRHFETMNRKLPEMDRGLATLLQDLSERGLLDSTIVWWGGEFGRTPKILWDAPWNGGRSHFGQCFSHLVAGGGFKGGQVVGASDAKGQEVAERPVSPQDLLGSMVTLLGIDPEGPLPNARGLDVKVMPSSANGAGGGLLHEIM